MIFEALAELELIDVKGFRLGDGTDDRMKRLVVRQRMDAVIAADELNEFVSHGWHQHGGNVVEILRGDWQEN